MAYKVTLNLKDKAHQFFVEDLDTFVETISKSSIIWLDNKEKGLWVNTQMLVDMLFEKIEMVEKPCDQTLESVSDCDQAMREACVHQQQTIEG